MYFLSRQETSFQSGDLIWMEVGVF